MIKRNTYGIVNSPILLEFLIEYAALYYLNQVWNLVLVRILSVKNDVTC